MAHCYLHSSYQLTSINALIASFKYIFWNCYQNRLKLENFYHINCHDLLLQIQRILKDEYLSVNIISQFSTQKYIYFLEIGRITVEFQKQFLKVFFLLWGF